MILISSSMVSSQILNFPRLVISFFAGLEGYDKYIEKGVNIGFTWLIGGILNSIFCSILLTKWEWLFKPILIFLLSGIITGYALFEYYLLNYDIERGNKKVWCSLILVSICALPYGFITFEWIV